MDKRQKVSEHLQGPDAFGALQQKMVTLERGKMVKSRYWQGILFLALVLGLAFLFPAVSYAQTPIDQQSQQCVACHQSSGIDFSLPSGEKVKAFLDVKNFRNSLHSQLACQSCHQDKKAFPHEKFQAQNLREYRAAASQACQTCHNDGNNSWTSSVHGLARQKGNVQAAVCADCHDAHATAPPSVSRMATSNCRTCHEKVTDSYQDSVHGKAALQGNKKAATCASCHSEDAKVHTMVPTADLVSLTQKSNIPLLCARCHTKAQESYKSTLHGRAWRLGKHDEFPTCIDCHGSYGVQTAHGAESALKPEKLGETCARCHTGADANFASGWMGHEEPSPKHFQIVWVTEKMFFYLTTITLAGGLLIVELDLLRWWTDKRKGNRKQ